MAKRLELPSTQDFSRPTPQPARGIASPRLVRPTAGEVQTSAVSGLGQAVSQAGAALAEAKLRIDKRQEAIQRTRLISSFSEQSNNELMRVMQEEQFGDTGILQNYIDFVDTKLGEVLGQFQGSEEGRLTLAQQLQQQRTPIAFNAASLSHQAQLQQVESMVGDQMSQINSTVRRDPTRLVDAIAQWQGVIGNVADTMTPNQEEAYLKTGIGHFANTAMDTLILFHQFDQVETILSLPGVIEALGPDGENKVKNNMLSAKLAVRNAQMAAFGEYQGRLSVLRNILGRDPSIDEAMAWLGKGGTAGESLFGKGVEGMALNYITNMSEPYKLGLLPPEQERIFEAAITEYTQFRTYMNPDTGLIETRRNALPPQAQDAIRIRGFQIPEADVPKLGGKTEDARTEEPSQTAWSLAGSITGPVPAGAEYAGRTPMVGGMLGGGGKFATARSFIPTIQKDLVRILQNNPKYAEGERQAIEQDIQIGPKIWDNQTAYRRRLIGISQALQIRLNNARTTAQSENVSGEERRHAMNVANGIQKFLVQLGVPTQIYTDEQYDLLAPGSEYIDPEGNWRTKGINQ